MKKFLLYILIVTSLFADSGKNVEWGEKAFFGKNWYGTLFYCIERGERLANDEEVGSEDIFTTGLNYIKARMNNKKAICVKDSNASFVKQQNLNDLLEVKKACGYDTSIDDSKEQSFKQKSTTEKIGEVASKTADGIGRAGMFIGGVALAVGTGGLAGGGLAASSIPDNNNEMRTTSSICEEAMILEKKLKNEDIR